MGGVMARAGACALAAALAMAALAGCATVGDGGLTLQAVKSPIQLLRNEAANRVPKTDIASVDHPFDTVEACRSSDEDPQQTWLTWQSSVLMTFTVAASGDMKSVRNTLADSFQAQGWTEGVADAVSSIKLQKKSSIATISIYTTSGDAAAAQGGTLRIDVDGPCVQTPGAASDEVRRLLGR